MIKLTEIFSIPIEYDSEIKMVKEKFSVREIYLNPSHIIFMRQNLMLAAKAQKKALVEDLNKNLVYTQIFLEPYREINVVGNPEHIMEKINEGV